MDSAEVFWLLKLPNIIGSGSFAPQYNQVASNWKWHNPRVTTVSGGRKAPDR